MIGLIPSMVVAIAVGRAGIDSLLVASQVVLSIVLPFVAFPLIWLTSSKSIMRVRKPKPNPPTQIQSESDEKDVADEPVVTIHEAPWYPGIIEIQRQAPSPPEISQIQEEKRETIIQVQEILQVDESGEDEYIDYSSGWMITCLASLIFIVVSLANIYVIVMLGLGRTG